MVKVRYGKAEYEVMKKFENLHHQDIWGWIIDKAVTLEADGKTLRVLHISDEASAFALLLADKLPKAQHTCAVRNEAPSDIVVPSNAKIVQYNTDEELLAIGKFDVIILTELTKDDGELAAKFTGLRTMFDGPGYIMILARPKNPPLPLPDVCLPLWRKIALTREEISDAAKKVEMTFQGFSVSVPITVPKFDWEAILFSGTIPVVKNTPKCTDKVITEFCKARPPKICFEEKLGMFLLKTE